MHWKIKCPGESKTAAPNHKLTIIFDVKIMPMDNRLIRPAVIENSTTKSSPRILLNRRFQRLAEQFHLI